MEHELKSRARRPAADSTTVQVLKTDHVRLTDVQAEMVVINRAHLTLGETIGKLIDFWKENHRES